MIYASRLNDLNDKQKSEILNIIQVGFDRSHDMLSSMNNPIVYYINDNNIIIAVAFGDMEEIDVVRPLKSNVLYIHTISVDENYRGKGLSSKLVKKMVRDYKSKYAIYLHVRTTSSNPNIAALKSYEKCGFAVVNAVYVNREDGPNNVMILVSQLRSNIFNKKGKKKTKRK